MNYTIRMLTRTSALRAKARTNDSKIVLKYKDQDQDQKNILVSLQPMPSSCFCFVCDMNKDITMYLAPRVMRSNKNLKLFLRTIKDES